MRYRIVCYFSMVFVTLLTAPVYGGGPDSRAELESLISEAVENNPELKSYERKTDAFEQRPSQAGSLDDPRVTVAIANLPVDSFRFDREPMTQKVVQLMQKIPFPGTLGIKEKLAGLDLAVVKTEYEETKNSLIRQVKVLYHTLLYLDTALKITGDNRDLLAEFIKAAEIKYETGQSGQSEIVKARLELSRIIQKIISLEQKRETAAVRLSTLLNRKDVQNNIVLSGELQQTAFTFTYDELQNIAFEKRPVLRGMLTKIDQSRLSVELAKKEYYPDLDFGVSYGQRDNGPSTERPDFVSASVTVNIPLWFRSKERKKVIEKKADRSRVEEQYFSMKNSISFRLQELMSQVNMHSREIDLFRTGIIPQATLSFESAMSGYRVNKTDLLTIINNQISLYNYEIEFYRAIADRENSLAELEETVGKRLF